jgi:hypothetical protein
VRARATAALVLGALLAGCAGSDPATAPSTYDDPALGFSFTLPAGWRMFAEEAKSRGNTLLNWQVKSLEGAEPAWLAGLPGTVRPELQNWTRHYFGEIRDEAEGTGTLGGEPALILSHTVLVGKNTTPSVVRYWAVRHGEALYLIRAVYPAGREAEEDPGVRALLGSWRFKPPSAPLPS